MNNCKGNRTYFEFFFKKSNCTYPLADLSDLQSIFGYRRCFLINTLSNQVWYRIKKNMSSLLQYSINHCDTNYLYTGYKDMKTQIMNDFSILSRYYNEYSIYRDYIIDNIILKSL